jgi:hypothetical protein
MPFSNALRIAFAQTTLKLSEGHHVLVNGSLGNLDGGGVNILLNSMRG